MGEGRDDGSGSEGEGTGDGSGSEGEGRGDGSGREGEGRGDGSGREGVGRGDGSGSEGEGAIDGSGGKGDATRSMLGTPRGTPVPPDTPPHGIPRLAHRPIRIASRPPLDVTDRAKFL